MREILFKAKRENWRELTDEQHWVEGYYWTNGLDNHFIRIVLEKGHFVMADCEIDPETLCQYTGINDSYDDKIWENDYIKFEDVGEEGYEYKEGFDFENVAKVVFQNGRWELDNFADYNSAVYEEMDNQNELISTLIYSKIIGNAFDNPGFEEGHSIANDIIQSKDEVDLLLELMW